jgi:antitoxin VapB
VASLTFCKKSQRCRIERDRKKEEMALNIKNPEADELARRLAQSTGRGITEVVIEALREKLLREQSRTGPPSLAREILEIGKHCASLPVRDLRSDDEILGYNEQGVWS